MIEPAVHFDPPFCMWNTLAAPSSGTVNGQQLETWQSQLKTELGLPTDKPIVVVGHQPTFFHPGILSKFIAGSELAKQLDGVLLFLVVDHHIGDVGTIEYPIVQESMPLLKSCEVATFDPTHSLRDQPRASHTSSCDIGVALQNAEGDSAAMQIAHALQQLMQPFANIDFVAPSSSLIHSTFGKAIVEKMTQDKQACIRAYNESVVEHPHCSVALLDEDELPLWNGPTNAKAMGSLDDIRPRALLLTLLARIGLADLFIHGTGGASYDPAMVNWAQQWLGISPCQSVTVSADVQLPLDVQTIESARSNYYSPQSKQFEKDHYLQLINGAKPFSEDRAVLYKQLHAWLQEQSSRPNIKAIKMARSVAMKRDWAFPLYDQSQLMALKHAMTNKVITKDCVLPKSASVPID